MASKDQPKTAFKIIQTSDYQAWRSSGSFSGASIDLTDGYIHLSTANQAGVTYSKYFVSAKDLVVVEVDLKPLGDTVKWEPSRNQELFPHVYGEIPASAIVRTFQEVDKALFDRLLETSPQ